MRALGMALVAVAAVVAGFSMAWRSEAAKVLPVPRPVHARRGSSSDLDAIRSAGL